VFGAALLLALVSPAPIGLITKPRATIGTYASSDPRSLRNAGEAHWSSQPTSRQIAAAPAAHIKGGARAMVHCSADAQGRLTGCWIESAEPDRNAVRVSALQVTTFYRLDARDTLKAKLSKRPAFISLILVFPDKFRTLPSDCNPNFECFTD
jgi:hypothetical protein